MLFNKFTLTRDLIREHLKTNQNAKSDEEIAKENEETYKRHLGIYPNSTLSPLLNDASLLNLALKNASTNAAVASNEIKMKTFSANKTSAHGAAPTRSRSFNGTNAADSDDDDD
jgi:hypothetical protein